MAFTWNCSDATSGVVFLSVGQTLSGQGASQSATGTCTDNAGNTKSDTQTGINIDLTNPNLSPTVTPNPVALGGSATANPNATDALSGIATQSCAALDTSSLGNKTVLCTATDKAGNTNSALASYSVSLVTLLGQTALNSLQGSLPTGNPATDTILRTAINLLGQSLNSRYFVDGTHLSPVTGQIFFSFQQAAVAQLRTLRPPPTAVTAALANLVQADTLLVQTAIADAIARGGNAK